MSAKATISCLYPDQQKSHSTAKTDTDMKRRYLLLCAPAIAVFLAAGCASSPDDAQPTDPPETTAPSSTAAPLGTSTTRPPTTTVTSQTTAIPPTTVASLPLLSGYVAVATADFSTCAVKSDGTVFCWGRNFFGELGDGTNEDSLEPVMVEGIDDAVSVTAGRQHYCALRQDGRVSCWGRNRDGRLGNGTFTDSNTPTPVSGINDAIDLSPGSSSHCALHADGSVSCWGLNRFGQLGDGTEDFAEDNPIPVKALNISDAIAIATGVQHTCALHTDSTVSCWGLNSSGQLGNGTVENSSRPTLVVGITDAIAIAAGSDYTCAILEDRTVSCWGQNYIGQLGNGETMNTSPVPVKVQGIDDAVSLAQSPSNYLCAFRSNSVITCWGRNPHNMLAPGVGEPPFYDLPSAEDRRIWSWDGSGEEVYLELPNSQDITALSLSRWHICSVLKDTTTHCWGPHVSQGNDFVPIP